MITGKVECRSLLVSLLSSKTSPIGESRLPPFHEGGDPFPGIDNITAFHAGTAEAPLSYQGTHLGISIFDIAESGDVVIAERLDRTQAGDKAVDLPCTGVFEIRDGKIASWRDYFDLGTYARAMQ